MTKERQRIVIAEVCGWKYHGQIGDRLLMWPPFHGDAGPPPDYLNDLNAINEAEKLLSAEPNPDKNIEHFTERERYVMMLEVVTKSNDGLFGEVHASAAQRSEAFLKTKELWED